tara:strand:+ start:874 stop:1380 length:507 start_codon:yes stop_codon:yes gene_type:complete
MPKRNALYLGLSIGTVLLVAWLLSPSNEDRIRSQFKVLERISAKTKESSTISDALALEHFQSLFSPEVILKTGERKRLAGKYSNRELMHLYGKMRLNFKRLSLRCGNIEVIALGKADATVTVEVYADGTDHVQNSVYSEYFRAKIGLLKIDGDWKFHQVDYLEPITSK